MRCASQATIALYLCPSKVEEPNRVEVAYLVYARFLGKLWTHESVVRAALIFSMRVPCFHQDIQPPDHT
jgi:hypothetical protein